MAAFQGKIQSGKPEHQGLLIMARTEEALRKADEIQSDIFFKCHLRQTHATNQGKLSWKALRFLSIDPASEHRKIWAGTWTRQAPLLFDVGLSCKKKKPGGTLFGQLQQFVYDISEAHNLP